MPTQALTPGTSGRTKGAAFREFVRTWHQWHGRAAIRTAVGGLPDAIVAHLNPAHEVLGILPSTWYPAEVPWAVVDACLAPIPRTQHPEVARQLAEVIMGETITGVYRAVFELLVTPDRYLKYAQRLWDLHYDSGTLTSATLHPGACRTELRDWRGHHPFICLMNRFASVPIFSSMGCTDVAVHLGPCVAEGGQSCTTEIRWVKT